MRNCNHRGSTAECPLRVACLVQGGYTALLNAVLRDNAEAMKCLINGGANVNTTSEGKLGQAGGHTPLVLAGGRSNVEMLEYLVHHGADVNAATQVSTCARVPDHSFAPSFVSANHRCLF